MPPEEVDDLVKTIKKEDREGNQERQTCGSQETDDDLFTG